MARPRGSSGASRRGALDVSSFRVLLDEPAERPGLGFDDLGRAFAEIVLHSKPRFAIGIFGSWGSGKTTLMGAIERGLPDTEEVVTVWFNAWRYEREPDLIVPLIDELRASLAERAAKAEEDGSRPLFRRVAGRLAQASRALVAGTKVKAGVPGVGFEVDAGAVADAWQGAGPPPSSFYYASFAAIREAIDEFVGPDPEAPARRIVVFVDDLDRCLPENALQVLESMKLFFDLPGFVFVVGLDREVIERAIEEKYRRTSLADAAEASAFAIRGTDYVKKIFQVPFGLPRISPSDLRRYFQDVISALPAEQQTHFDAVVWKHLRASTAGLSVNPREVKRLLNAYTLQMKVLTAKLGAGGVNADAVLALQVMAFRPDWEPFYVLLAADPPLFVQSVAPPAGRPRAAGPVVVQGRQVPRPLLDYLRGTGLPLLTVPDLLPYIESTESTHSTDPGLIGAQKLAADLRELLRGLTEAAGEPGADEVSQVEGLLSQLRAQVTEIRSTLAREAVGQATALEKELRGQLRDPAAGSSGWPATALRSVVALEETLSAIRSQVAAGPTSG